MPTDELADFMEQMLGGIEETVSLSPAVLAFERRMRQRDERRLREGWTPEQVARGSRNVIRTRPSDGQPTGSAFNYEEYLTRLEDRRAADPEAYQRERASRIRARRSMFDGYKETHDFDRCNEALKEERLNRVQRYGSYNRLLDIWSDIWSVIVQTEQVARLEAIHLDQASRIANIKNLERCQGRVRGIGAAARRAGY